MVQRKRYGKRGRVVRRKRIVRKPRFRRRTNMPRYMPRKPEVKTTCQTSAATVFNQGISSAADCLRLFPAIVTGTSGTHRIGEKINMLSMRIRGTIVMNGGNYTDSQNCRIGVRVMIVRAKKFNDYDNMAADFGTSYVRLLQDSGAGFIGQLYDLTSPVNREYFSVIKDKRFYLSRSVTSLTVPTAQLDRSFAFFNWNLPYHKRTLTWDNQDDASYPTNYPYAMLIGFVKLDGTGPDGGTTTNLTVQYTTEVKYTDY